jgi:hypothetical protein
MSDANCFIVLEHERGSVAVGDTVRCSSLTGWSEVRVGCSRGSPKDLASGTSGRLLERPQENAGAIA